MSFSSLSHFYDIQCAMQIQIISYERNRRLRDGDNEIFRATAYINEGENLDRCVKHLKDFVTKQLYPPKDYWDYFTTGKPGEDPDDEIQSF